MASLYAWSDKTCFCCCFSQQQHKATQTQADGSKNYFQKREDITIHEKSEIQVPKPCHDKVSLPFFLLDLLRSLLWVQKH